MNVFVRNRNRIEKSGLLLSNNTSILSPAALVLVTSLPNEITSEKLLSYKFILSKNNFKFLIRWILFELVKKKKCHSGKIPVMWPIAHKSDFTLALALKPSVINYNHTTVTHDLLQVVTTCRALLFLYFGFSSNPLSFMIFLSVGRNSILFT